MHRDLKPENTIVSDDGIVKILDFGLAKLVRSPFEAGVSEEGATATMGTEPGLLLGTYAYMSPEQASGKPVDFRSDQFSFGSILYEMATGQRAFQKSQAVDTLSAIVHAEPEPIARWNAAFPTPLRWIVERCLAKDPRDRYASTEDLARDLTSLREHLSEASQAGARFAPLAQRRLPLWVLPAVAGAVVLAAGLLAGRFLVKAPLHPHFQQLTFRRGGIWGARFAPDGQTVVYGASWEGKPLELFSTRAGSAEYRSLGLERSDILSISLNGEMAVLMGQSFGLLLRPPHDDMTIRDPRMRYGTVARVPLAGGTPRELVERALWADWGPEGDKLAVVHEVDGMHRLEFPIGTVVYEAAPWINRPRVSRDGKSVIFQDNKDLWVVEPPGKARGLGKPSEEIAWSATGREIWYTRYDGVATAIRAVLPSGRGDREVYSFPGDYVLYDIAADGRVLLGRAAETSQIYGLLAGEVRPRDLSWFDKSDVRGLSQDGKTVLFDETGPSGGTYLRGTDGSPAKRVGDGGADDLSPDGNWVLIGVSNPDPEFIGLRMTPTGPGQPRSLPRALEDEWGGQFLADGKRIFSIGGEKGRMQRGWIREIGSEKATPVTPERTFRIVPSPDGKFASALGADGTYRVYSVETGASAPIDGLRDGEEPIQWSRDGRSLFVRGADETVANGGPAGKVYRLDPWTGRRELFRELPSVDSTAGGGIGRIIVSADEKSIVYTHYRFPSELFLVEGLR